jgi:predicted RNase H-like HicB family nuclease
MTAIVLSDPKSTCRVDRFKVYTEKSCSYSCVAVAERDDEGYVAWIENLPGVVGQGASFAEAFNDVEQALSEVLAEYLKSGGRIPWSTHLELPSSDDYRKKTVAVNVKTAED